LCAANFCWFADKVFPVVGSLVSGGAAERAGFASGDRIVSINGAAIASFDDIKYPLNNSTSAIFRVSAVRGGAPIEVELTPELREFPADDGCPSYLRIAGIGADDAAKGRFSLREALQRSGIQLV